MSELDWTDNVTQRMTAHGDYRAIINHDSEWYVMCPKQHGQPNAPVLSGSSETLRDAKRCCAIAVRALEEIDDLGGKPGWRL